MVFLPSVTAAQAAQVHPEEITLDLSGAAERCQALPWWK